MWLRLALFLIRSISLAAKPRALAKCFIIGFDGLGETRSHLCQGPLNDRDGVVSPGLDGYFAIWKLHHMRMLSVYRFR